MLQRVAFLLYQYRGNLHSGQIILFSPNQLFNDYINQVLPGITYGTGDGNETANAIKDAIDDPQLKTEKIIPFSSERKWSGVGFSDGHDYVFGAPQFIFKELSPSVQSQITKNAELGYR